MSIGNWRKESVFKRELSERERVSDFVNRPWSPAVLFMGSGAG